MNEGFHLAVEIC